MIILSMMLLISCRKQEYDADKQAINDLIELIDHIRGDTLALHQKLHFYIENDNTLAQLLIYEKLGSAYRVNALFSKAIHYHRKGLELATELQDTIKMAQALNNLGTDFRRIGALAEASDYHFKALQISENYSFKNDSVSVKNKVIALNGIGNISLSLMRLDEAAQYFSNALTIEKQLNSKLGQAINYANLGSVYENKMQYDSALIFYRNSMELNKEIGSNLGISLCYSHIGDLLLDQKQYTEALKNYQHAYAIMEKSPDKWHWLDICLSIGNLYMQKKDYVQALHFVDLARKTAIEIESRDHLIIAYDYLSKIHRVQGNYKEALDEVLNCQQYSDSIKSDRQINLLIDMRLKNDHEKTLDQIRELHRQNEYHIEQNKGSKLIIISLIIMLISSVIVLYYRIRFNRKKEEEMRRLETMKSNFFMNITHEFRTPITVILGLSNHIQEINDGSNQLLKHHLNAIIRQGKNLLHLVNQMLDFAKSEAKSSNPVWKNGNVVDFLRFITDSFEQYTESKKIHLVFYSDEHAIFTDFVPSYLRKIMSNLIANAIKHCKENDKIIINVGQYDKEYYIQIVDTGEGIMPEDLPHVFELYFQSKNNQSINSGSGIGLALTQKLVEELNGNIRVKSTPNKETSFRITLPVSLKYIDNNTDFPNEDLLEENEMMYLNDIQDKQLLQITPNQDINKQASVLIVEDNNDIAFYIASVLEKNYEVKIAQNGAEGIKLAQEILPDMIITDLIMPEKDGISLVREIRNSLAVCHIPIIIITAKDSVEDRIQGLEAGADAYLSKPFDENELLVIVRKIIENRLKLKEQYAHIIWQEENIKTDDVNIRFLQQITSIIYREIKNADFFPQGLASEMCLSVSQLKRKLRDLSGVNFSTFIMQARLNHAKKLLKNTDKTVSEIAYECGFSDLGYFSRSFKNSFGFAPSQYQRLPG